MFVAKEMSDLGSSRSPLTRQSRCVTRSVRYGWVPSAAQMWCKYPFGGYQADGIIGSLPVAVKFIERDQQPGGVGGGRDARVYFS